MPHPVAVNIRVTLRDDLARRIDRLVGPRRRAAFVERAVERALDNERRWELIWSAVGTIHDRGQEWDRDP
jgi:metal-responsive CopG/Arc/MetJ family transcriptional regulator